ncbi:MAG TPA: hypothetical protein PKW35_17780, partial [Nannocystaceae bacterium]|nr:hypothetical protein [Nannocystaceae bacterium]
MRTNTSPFRGGYYSHGKQFIESLPVPVPTDQQRSYIEALVGQLIEMKEALAAARIPHQRITRERQAADLKIQIENEITALFSLSAGDMEIIRDVPAPS